ncbi:MAG: methyltransferase domain-containing protein [Chryseobacterium sp.]|jgi:trans-aconitate 2-methyltransferase|uniref:methyltransferase domain-containing protein n=1 Tax=Chryseobacterium sp. TaxID=1871047 RepID=UPI002836A3DC|nr:methyltransferase domain-containing protein [Chryseobacterium sp.]MDR2235802.1 methyltransferase domain-containing protein [Chryseobacterium sp.]
MPWNPDLYDQYKDVRYQPFYDLAALIRPENNIKAIDLGCGTGEQASILQNKLPGSVFLGIDSSPEMLEKARKYEHENLHFKLQTIEEAAQSEQKWDLVFSNAALQWADDHEKLFPEIIGLLSSGGQLAIQMPVQNENILNQILMQMTDEEPYASYLNHFKRNSPVLSMDEYAQILFDHGIQDIEIFQKVYPIIADDHEALYTFISGTSLLPYLERLEGEQKEKFIREFKLRIAQRFTKYPAIYAFKRTLMYGRKK